MLHETIFLEFWAKTEIWWRNNDEKCSNFCKLFVAICINYMLYSTSDSHLNDSNMGLQGIHKTMLNELGRASTHVTSHLPNWEVRNHSTYHRHSIVIHNQEPLPIGKCMGKSRIWCDWSIDPVSADNDFLHWFLHRTVQHHPITVLRCPQASLHVWLKCYRLRMSQCLL